MRRAIILARRGRGAVSPNPRVGAVVVDQSGRVIAEGWHHRFGEAHAERDALTKVPAGAARGGTLYVNLEPCCHSHKTPPCTEAIISAGLKRVVAAIQDPFPAVNGCGFRALAKTGVEVVTGVLQVEAIRLNRGFFSVVERGRAWCAAKVALSLDGKLANHQRLSKWISGPEARKLAHELRADHDGILVGGGVIEADDPELTVRLVKGPNPTRIILSPTRGIPSTSKIAQSAGAVRTILVVGEEWQGMAPTSVELLRLPTKSGKIDPRELLRRLPEFGVASLLIEGGTGVLSGFMSAGVLDEISVAYAPSVIGRGLSPFDEFEPFDWANRPRYWIQRVRRYGEDVVVTYLPESALSSRE